MDVTPFTRILVAGFISGGSDDVDGNLETVRLLRSQLRSKSTLRVIEAEVLPLVDIARGQGKEAGRRPSSSSETTGGGAGQTPADPPPATPSIPQQPPAGEPRRRQQPPPTPAHRAAAPVPWPGVDDGKIRNEKTSSATSRSSRTSPSGRSSANSTRIR
jgi:hypothetical protein